jgi:hypothetical protein
MDRDAFLAQMRERIRELRAPEEQRRARAAARSERIAEIRAIIEPYADALTADGMTNALVTTGTPSEKLTWTLALDDGTQLVLTVADHPKQERLGISFTHTAHSGIYLDLSFLGKREPADKVEKDVTRVHLDERWSAQDFEQIVQDMVTAYVDEASQRG